MTRPLPSSEVQLTRAQIRELVACPLDRCKAPRGEWCRLFQPAGPNHGARVDAARALLRQRRLR